MSTETRRTLNSCAVILGACLIGGAGGWVSAQQPSSPPGTVGAPEAPGRAGQTPRPGAQDPKALEVLRAGIKAVGGEAAILGRKTIYFKRRVINHEYPDPREGTITIYFKRPDRIRKEISYPGLKQVEAFDGKQGWVDQGAGPQVLGSRRIGTIMDGLADLDVPASYLDAELTYFNISQEIPGRLAHVVKVRKAGYTRELMFDVNDNLLALAGEYENPWGATDKMTKYDRYRPVDGLLVPHHEERWRSNRMVLETDVVEVRFNQPIDDALFAFPGPPPAP